MDMKVVVGATTPNHLPPSIDHMNQANSNCSTPYMSAASSPQHHHHRHRPQLDFFYYSAPTSPRSSSSHFNNDHRSLFDDVYDDYTADHVSLLKHEHSSVTVPFNWELEPGVAKTNNTDEQKNDEDEEKDDFEFEFSGQLDMMVRPSLSSADELFDGGKIRPLKLKPPPNLHINHDHNKISTTSGCTSPKSPKSAMSKFKDALSGSPKHRRNGSDIDPFEAAIRNTRESSNDINNGSQERGRGRDRVKPITPANTSSNNKRGSNNNGCRKGMSRSLSPLRVSEFALLDHQQLQDNQQQSSNETSNLARILGMGFPSSSKKWRLKDLFLFRSASEGHYKDSQSYSKRWSFRSSTMGSVSGSGSGSVSESGSVSKRRGQQASAHEMHYTSNRAVSEEMKKKTSLPYKHGLLACLGFSPVLPQFSYTFPSSTSTPFS